MDRRTDTGSSENIFFHRGMKRDAHPRKQRSIGKINQVSQNCDANRASIFTSRQRCLVSRSIQTAPCK